MLAYRDKRVVGVFVRFRLRRFIGDAWNSFYPGKI
jgi:hypothetical protein